MSDQDDETDSDDGQDLMDVVPEEAREAYPEESISEADDEEVLQEYYDTVHHLGVCEAEGQIDMTEERWAGILKEEILSRMSEDYTPTY